MHSYRPPDPDSAPPEDCVLIVEDSWHDLVLMSYVLDEQGLRNCVHAERSGKEALAYLEKTRRSSSTHLKAMMIDLCLPDMHGSELVDAVRNDPVLRGLPIVVFSGSTLGLSPQQERSLASSTVVEKPIAFSDFQNVFLYWLRSLLQPEVSQQMRA